jgi:hypothetical protein
MRPRLASVLTLSLTSAVATLLPASAPASAQTAWQEFHAPVGWHTPTFLYPSHWRVYHYQEASSFSTLVAYLSTVHVPDPCVRTPTSISCGRPLNRLSDSDILVTWTENGFPTWNFASVKGRRIVVGGQPAKLQTVVGSVSVCPALTQESLDLVINRRGTDNYWEMLACIRGPGLTGYAAHVMRMIRSVRNAA